MSFWKSLFGGKKPAEPKGPALTDEHKGFRIEAWPYLDNGQYQLAGVISKEIDGVRREHRFVRADRFNSPDEAASFALVKARIIIDEQGDRLLA